jgi:hypothetical protein
LPKNEVDSLIKISMRLNRLATFIIGVITTTACLGFVTYVQAADETTVKACASKSNGTMRYLSKGSCKKTETRLTWNQAGMTGLPGATGPKGETGSKGDAGSSGANGINGQNYFLVGGDGKTIGPILGVDAGTAMVMFGGSLFNVNLANGSLNGGLNLGWYSDSNCKFPFAIQEALTNPLLVGVDYQDAGGVLTPKFFKATGSPAALSTKSRVYRNATPCTEMDSSNRTAFATSIVYATVEITGPQITLPLSIALR